MYPDFDWLPWKFEQCPKHYWNDPKNVRKYMDWAGTQLGIKQLTDWYKISFTVKKKLNKIFDFSRNCRNFEENIYYEFEIIILKY